MQQKNYNNILVINLMHIGDLMLVTPVLRTLRMNYPKARITLVADKKLADLVVCNKHIDNCLFLDKKGADNHPLAFLRFIRRIQKEHFDLSINLHRNERASALAAFSGAKRIVGYAKPLFSMFFDHVMENKKAIKHQIHSHFDVLEEAVGIRCIDDGGLEMWLSEGTKERAAMLWQKAFPKKTKVIALNIGASWQTKRWPSDYFAQVGDNFLEKGYGIAFFGGPTDKPLVASCRAKMRHSDHKSLYTFTGSITLAELAALIKKCVLFITTDSGPMHIGVAMNVPIVTMFGASPVPGFYPYDAKDILLKTPEACHPCGKHQCPRKGEKYMACMKNIPVKKVLHYAEELLAQYENSVGKMPAHYGQYQCKVVEL